MSSHLNGSNLESHTDCSNGLNGITTGQPVSGPPVALASTADRIVVQCPNCRATLRVRPIYLGHSVQCKNCNHVFPLPASGDPASKPAEVLPHGVIAARAVEHPHVEESTVRLQQAYERLLGENERLAREHRELESKCKEHEEQCQQMAASIERLTRDHHSQLEAEQTKQKALTEELFQLRADSDETSMLANQLIAMKMSHPDHSVPAPELEAVRALVDELTQWLADSDRLNHALAEILQGLGTKFRPPVPSC